jgi:hypothetical protein
MEGARKLGGFIFGGGSQGQIQNLRGEMKNVRPQRPHPLCMPLKDPDDVVGMGGGEMDCEGNPPEIN